MVDGHERFEALALGHALGGLDAAEAGALRTHLRACVACRARVAELRDLASDLDAAARDERRRGIASRRRPTAASEPESDEDRPHVARRRGRMLVVVLAAASLPLAFWNLHLRSAAATYFGAAEDRGAVIELVAGPASVAVGGLGAMTGRIAVDAARVAVVLLDVGPLDSDERLVAWLAVPGAAQADAAGADAPAPGSEVAWVRHVLAVGPATEVAVSTLIDRGVAVRLRVTRERGLLGAAPSGATLVDVDLAMLADGQARSSGSSSK